MLFIEETSDTNRTVVDLSKQSLKKIPKNENVQDIRQLILDDNELQKFDNIDSYAKVEKVSFFRCVLKRNVNFWLFSVVRVSECPDANVLRGSPDEPAGLESLLQSNNHAGRHERSRSLALFELRGQ